MSAAALLERLEHPKQTGPGRWIARCPAHNDRNPSLSVRELDDGRVLINCFAGCGAVDVLGSLELNWSALFPASHAGRREFAPSHSQIPARDLLTIISEEVSVVAIVAADLLDKGSISENDWRRLATAAARIAKARDHVRG